MISLSRGSGGCTLRIITCLVIFNDFQVSAYLSRFGKVSGIGAPYALIEAMTKNPSCFIKASSNNRVEISNFRSVTVSPRDCFHTICYTAKF